MVYTLMALMYRECCVLRRYSESRYVSSVSIESQVPMDMTSCRESRGRWRVWASNDPNPDHHTTHTSIYGKNNPTYILVVSSPLCANIMTMTSYQETKWEMRNDLRKCRMLTFRWIHGYHWTTIIMPNQRRFVRRGYCTIMRINLGVSKRQSCYIN